MDKSTLETYEFIPVNTEGGPDQFFIVQDDGTYLINRQVQYVTEVQDVKTVLDGVQSCTVYDVSEQPFYVDVDNSSELMSVSDQFVLPDGSSNLYANSYLLQPGTTPDQVEEDITEAQFKPSNSSIGLDIEASINKPVNNCTEITLSDSQYQKLEQKGWLLLELNDKVFVLDTLGGLRDITANDKLIQKLKNDDQTDSNWGKSSESLSITQNLNTQPNTIEFVISNDVAQNNGNIEDLPLVDSKDCKDNILQGTGFINQETGSSPIVKTIDNNTAISLSEPCIIPQQTDPYKDVKIFLVESEKDDEQNPTEKKFVKIKTKLSLEDIPDRIVLGKTVNGKTLVARVKKTDEAPKHHTEIVVADSSLNNSINGTFDTEELQFSDLIKQAMQNPEQLINAKDLQAIEIIIQQLTQVPEFDPGIHGNDCLFITKVVKRESDKGNSSIKSNPIIWTGSVKAIDNQWRFVHMPYILQNILVSDEYKSGSSTVIHIQILEEVRQGTNVYKTSVTVNKKQLLPSRPKKKETVYACSACAAVFNSEQELKEHRAECLDSMDTSDLLTIDVDTPINIRCIKSGKNKYYACMQCQAKFTKLSACKKHLKTHCQETNDGSSNDDKGKTKKKNSGIFKCNMCASVYLHSSTLSKHIVTRHIKGISN